MMSKAKAIYAWWRRLPLWARIPLALVLLVALVVLAFEWLMGIGKRKPAVVPSREAIDGLMAQAKHSSAELEAATEKANEKYSELQEELKNDQMVLRGFEDTVGDCYDFDCVDGVLSGHVKRQRAREKND